MIVSAIAAMSENRVIGLDGGLPWDLPEDMKFFREKTKGHIIVMGRKTFESFPKLLPNRLHVVITRAKDFSADGAVVCNSVESALQFCREKVEAESKKWGTEIFVIGGGEIYKAALPYTDTIYLTEIHKIVNGDTKFPDFDKTTFHEVDRQPRTGPVPFDFVIYRKK